MSAIPYKAQALLAALEAEGHHLADEFRAFIGKLRGDGEQLAAEAKADVAQLAAEAVADVKDITAPPAA